MEFSVIVPVYRERERVNALLDHLEALARRDNADLEVLVPDGADPPDTIEAISRPGVVRLAAPPGRGSQMNAAAAVASGDILLFLHADTLLPERAFSLVRGLLENPVLAGGAFDLVLDDPGPVFRLIGSCASLRSRVTRVPYGDQAIFVRSPVFRSIGGFRDIPLFEDVDLMMRIKRAKLPIGFLDSPVTTSARRWKKEGITRTTLRNWSLCAAYLAGVSPERLAGFYRPHRP